MESRDAKSERLFHTLCYQNQIDNVCPEKIELSSMSQRSGVRDQGAAKSKFQETSPLLQRKSSKIDCTKHFPMGGRKLAPFYPGGSIFHLIPPHDQGPELQI